jgi:transposase
MNRTTYGLDIAKNVMQLHWVDTETGEIGRKKLARAKLSEFFARLQPVRVVMEACGSAHHWARVLGALGHQIELLPARQVRPFVRSNKDDAADARAIWVAAQQSDIRRVPLKSVAQQAALALHRSRQHWVSVRTATINALRGTLYEFGVTLAGGKHAGLKALTTHRAEIDAKIPATIQRLIDGQLATLKEIGRRTTKADCTPAPIPPMFMSSLRPYREPQGVGSPTGEATELCGWQGRLRGMDAVGNRGFSGAANAARGHAPRGVQALILMGDWCASA